MSTEQAVRYESGISENNLKHWGILEAVKEFIQNNIYASTILGDETSINHDGTMAIITNAPSSFSKGKLLIGESEQADVVGAPGQYGEGMKVAMAIARRLGRKCEVHTSGFIVRPELEPSSLDPSVRVLTYYIEDTDVAGGTTFFIECTEEELEEAKGYFAVLNGIDKEVVKKDAIITGEKYAGNMFVNGVKVTDMDAIFAYNFTNPELMNRDRTSLNVVKVKAEVKNMLCSIMDVPSAAFILQQIVENDSLLEAQAGLSWPSNLSIWREASQMAFGNKVAMATGSDSDTKARYHKFTVLTNVPSSWKYFFNEQLDIPYTNQLEEVAEKPKNTHVKPNREETDNLGWAKMLIKKYYADYGTVRVSEKVVDQHGTECDGLYDPKTGVTWLKRAILSDKKATFTTLLHETIHRVTGASDNTAEFTQAWEDACWAILQKGSAKVAD